MAGSKGGKGGGQVQQAFAPQPTPMQNPQALPPQFQPPGGGLMERLRQRFPQLMPQQQPQQPFGGIPLPQPQPQQPFGGIPLPQPQQGPPGLMPFNQGQFQPPVLFGENELQPGGQFGSPMQPQQPGFGPQPKIGAERFEGQPIGGSFVRPLPTPPALMQSPRSPLGPLVNPSGRRKNFGF